MSMLRRITMSAAALAVALVPFSPATARASEPEAPTPSEAVRKACDAAGGARAFAAAGLLAVEIRSSETVVEGKQSQSLQVIYFQTPGPVPGRMEVINSNVIAGDNGDGGWALINNRPDPRDATDYMVRRAISTTLFPILLPFSLNWDGASVTAVEAAMYKGVPVWRLRVVMTKSFFVTPQIATEWIVDLDRETWQVLRAESPFMDLGNNIVADGMRFTRSDSTTIAGLTLPTVQLVLGLDRAGKPRAHTRVDELSYKLISAPEASRLFANPIPPEMRAKAKRGQAPASPPQR